MTAGRARARETTEMTTDLAAVAWFIGAAAIGSIDPTGTPQIPPLCAPGGEAVVFRGLNSPKVCCTIDIF